MPFNCKAPNWSPGKTVLVPGLWCVLKGHHVVVRVGSICSGFGGMELGLSMAGIRHNLAWWSDVDRSAITVMEAHTDAPNLGDVRSLSAPPSVDIVTAGFPCQPVSRAGRKRGSEDPRWIIRDVCRVAREANARWLLLENPVGILTTGDGVPMARVCEALADQGFGRWEWITLRASSVGAPHRRERWFCLATDTDRPGWAGGADSDSGEVAGWWPWSARRCSCPLHAASLNWWDDRRITELESDFGKYAPAVGRWEQMTGQMAPSMWRGRWLNPVFVEWMLGLPDGWVTEHLWSQNKRFQVLGSGVPPHQMAAGVHLLFTAFQNQLTSTLTG